MTDKEDSQESRASVKERILTAAVEAFAANGFAGTRVGEIAVNAKVNQALIYYYFESKERLYQEVLNGLFERWEAMLSRLDWEGKDVTAFVREYIRAQYEMKYRMPHLYKIFHWETLEGGGLFDKYASSMWTQDFYDIAGKLTGWKTEGAIRSQTNEKVLLFLLFGMMDQFYFRKAEGLAAILGKEGGEEQLHAEVVEEMVALTLHGVLPKAELSKPGGSPPGVAILADGETEMPEVRQLLETLKDAGGAGLRAVDLRAPEGALGAENGLVLVVVSTSVGEIPSWLLDWLKALKRNPTAAEGRTFAIWTLGDEPAAQRLQRMLEESFNDLGGYAVSRLRGQSPGDYARRCLRWIHHP